MNCYVLSGFSGPCMKQVLCHLNFLKLSQPKKQLFIITILYPIWPTSISNLPESPSGTAGIPTQFSLSTTPYCVQQNLGKELEMRNPIRSINKIV